MSKRKRRLDLVIELLNKEKDQLLVEIAAEKGLSKEKVELKEQISDAILNLELCSQYDLFAKEISVIALSEEGSDSYFTEYNVVDESTTNQIPNWAIQKHKGEEIKLDCFDLIIKK